MLTPAEALYLPAWQSSQAVLTPVEALNLPASQLVQWDLPALPWNFPAEQSKHSAADVAAVAVLYFPASQSVQAAAPVCALYLPARQPAQEPPLGPV